MRLDHQLLRDALRNLVASGYTLDEMMREAGVSNLSRIANGRINPGIKTWARLHKAYPEHIPAPADVKGRTVAPRTMRMDNSHGSNQAGRDNNIGGASLTPMQSTIIDLLNKFDGTDESLAMGLLTDLMAKVKEA